jgi:hypothetical protein
MKTWHWIVVAVVALWAFARVKAANDRDVPLALAFQHPFTDLGTIRRVLLMEGGGEGAAAAYAAQAMREASAAAGSS